MTVLVKPAIRDQPLVSIVIPVGGNRTKSLDKLEACVSSILQQNYPNIELILVVDPDNKEVKEHRFSQPVRLVEYVRPPFVLGRDKNARAKKGWDSALGDILGLTGVCIVWEPNLINTALKIMEKQGVQAIDGVTRRMPKDEKSFLGVFQDEALVTEWSHYKRDFLLTKSTRGQDLHLPTFNSFFMTRQFYRQVDGGLAVYAENCWDDFRMASAMVDSGGAFFCTNRLVAYRNHPLSLRLGKQFSSGLSGVGFYIDFPENPYARKRLRLTLMVAVLALVSMLAASILMATTSPLLGFSIAIGALLAALVPLGAYNAFKAKYWWGLLFPPLTALQVLTWVIGYLYGGVNNSASDSEFLRWLHQKR